MDMLLILIRQMVALVRRALAEVCTVPEVLVCATSVPNIVHMFSLYILPTFFVFNALTLLVGHQEEHPACKNRVIMCWHGYLSGVGAGDLHIVQLIPLPPIVSCFIKIQTGLTILMLAY